MKHSLWRACGRKQQQSGVPQPRGTLIVFWLGTVASASVSISAALLRCPVPACVGQEGLRSSWCPLLYPLPVEQEGLGRSEASGRPCGACAREEGPVLSCDGASLPAWRSWARSLVLAFEGQPMSLDCSTVGHILSPRHCSAKVTRRTFLSDCWELPPSTLGQDGSAGKNASHQDPE